MVPLKIKNSTNNLHFCCRCFAALAILFEGFLPNFWSHRIGIKPVKISQYLRYLKKLKTALTIYFCCSCPFLTVSSALLWEGPMEDPNLVWGVLLHIFSPFLKKLCFVALSILFFEGILPNILEALNRNKTNTKLTVLTISLNIKNNTNNLYICNRCLS